MLPSTKNLSKIGLTLVELLITIGIVSTLSLVSVRLLWDSLSVRSTQYATQYSSDDFRLALKTMTKAIQEAETLNVPDSLTLETTGTSCYTFRYNATLKSLEQAIDSSASCAPPSSGFIQMTQDEIKIDTFQFSPVGERAHTVKIDIVGKYKDSTVSHPFKFNTTVTSRVTL